MKDRNKNKCLLDTDKPFKLQIALILQYSLLVKDSNDCWVPSQAKLFGRERDSFTGPLPPLTSMFTLKIN